MKKNNSKLEFEINIRSDRFLQKYCPFEREEVEKAIEFIIPFKKDENWLYEASQNNSSLPLIEAAKIELLKK